MKSNKAGIVNCQGAPVRILDVNDLTGIAEVEDFKTNATMTVPLSQLTEGNAGDDKRTFV